MKILSGIYVVTALAVCLYFNVVGGESILNLQTTLKTSMYNPDTLMMYRFMADFLIIGLVPPIGAYVYFNRDTV